MSTLRAEKSSHSTRWHLPEILSAAQERLQTALKKHLASKIKLVTPYLYQHSWKLYAQQLYRVGGCIEACPKVITHTHTQTEWLLMR